MGEAGGMHTDLEMEGPRVLGARLWARLTPWAFVIHEDGKSENWMHPQNEDGVCFCIYCLLWITDI